MHIDTAQSLVKRLLREDGKCDDDVGGLLSQVRAKRIEISMADTEMGSGLE